MSASNGKLSGLKGKPASFTLKDGTEVTLRTITFDERTDLIQWSDDNRDLPNKGLLLERKLAALALDASAEEVGQFDPEKVDEIAFEAGARCGLYRRDGEKKVTPSDSSDNQTSSSSATSPLPAG